MLFFVITYGFISALQVFDVPWLLTGSSFTAYGGRRNALLFPVMDMMGRAFGAVRFGEAAAYGFILTAIIILVHRRDVRAARLEDAEMSVARASATSRAMLADLWTWRFLKWIVAICVAIVAVLPIWWMINVVFSDPGTPVSINPRLYPTSIESGLTKIRMILTETDYLRAYYITVAYSLLTIVGVLFIGSMAAFEFALFDFPGKRVLFGLVMLSLMVPTVVTIIPTYLLVAEPRLAEHDAGPRRSRARLRLRPVHAGAVHAHPADGNDRGGAAGRREPFQDLLVHRAALVAGTRWLRSPSSPS